MNFSEWLRIDEIEMADEGINFNYSNGVGRAEFQQMGMNFRVDFNMVTSYAMGEYIPDVYNVVFSGPSGTFSTGRAGSGALAIYSKVMGAIKKLMDATNVNGIAFSAAEDKMAPVYQRLFKRLGGDFVQISNTEYIKRSVLKGIIKKSPEYERADFYQGMMQRKRLDRENRNDKLKLNRLKASNGKIVMLTSGQPFLIAGVDTEGYVLGIMPTRQGLTSMSVGASSVSNYPVDAGKLQSFVSLLQSHLQTKDPEIARYIPTIRKYLEGQGKVLAV